MELKSACLTAAAALLLGSAAAATAGDAVLVRLVEASRGGEGSPAGIEDVLDVLKRSLPYTSFRLVSQANQPIGGRQSASVGGYAVLLQGAQDNLSITVSLGGRELVRTVASLKDRKPLVVGGFPSGRGAHVLVFVAR